MGRTLIERAVQNSQPATVLEDELIEVIGNMPMSTLANFGGMSLDHALDQITADWQQQQAAP
jgi:beta-glucosidase